MRRGARVEALRMHRHNTPLRGVKAIPRPKPGDSNYAAVNYEYAGKTGHIHEVVTMDGRDLAKVGRRYNASERLHDVDWRALVPESDWARST